MLEGESKPALLDTLIDRLLKGIGGETPEADAEPGSKFVTFDDLVIRTKDKRLITFRPNDVQQLYLPEIAPSWESGDYSLRGIKDILLKARQFGFTTLIEALFFCDTINTPNTATVVVAHDLPTTERIFRMVQLFYEHLPEHKKPRTKYATKREFFWPDINSSFFVGTAGSGSFGRSATINNLHCSEVAFYPDPDELMTGLLQAVPEGGNIFLETTAKGLGNWYHQEYSKAEKNQSSFRAKFFGWNLHPEYQVDLEGKPLAPATSLDERQTEERYRKVYSVTDEQLEWRRRKMREPGMAAKFPQEYPISAREAFLTSGNKYFSKDGLAKLADRVEAGTYPAIEFTLPEQLGPEIEFGQVLAREKEHLNVYDLPEPGSLYVIGADTAEGLNEDGDHDNDAAVVFDAETWQQVAVLYGQWDTHSYGVMLAQLGYWYNTALLAIERNNHGHAVINAALHTAKYPEMKKGDPRGLYKHEEWDENKRAKLMKLGWPTTPKTKYFALDGLAASIDNDDLVIKSPACVAELTTFVKKPNGKAGGEGKSHDDLVTALSIADAVLKLRPRKIEAKFY